MKAKIQMALLALLLAPMLWAAPKSTGEKWLDKGIKDWKSFQIDLLSIPRDTVIQELKRAVKQLEKESNVQGVRKGTLLLAQIYGDSYDTYEIAGPMFQRVIDMAPGNNDAISLMARLHLVAMGLYESPQKAANLMLKEIQAGRVNLEILDSYSDLFYFYHVFASVCYWIFDFRTCGSIFNTLLSITEKDLDKLDRFDCIAYLCTMSDYFVFLTGRGYIDEGVLVMNECYRLIEKKKLNRSAAIPTFLRSLAQFQSAYGARDDAKASLESAFNLASKGYDEWSEERVETLALLCESYARTEHADEMTKVMGQIVKGVKKVTGPRSFASYRMLCSYGNCFAIRKNFERARAYYKEAVELAEKCGYHYPYDLFNYICSLDQIGMRGSARKQLGTYLEWEREYIKNTFMALSEQSRENYWKVSGYSSIAFTTDIAASTLDTLGRLYDLSLFSKGLLMESSSQFLEWASSQKDPSFQAHWKEYQQIQGQLRELDASTPQGKADKASLQKRMLALDTQLLSEGMADNSYMDMIDCTWKQVDEALKPGDIAIEFVRNKNKTGVYYFASVLRKGCVPVNVFLPGFKEETIEAMPLSKKYSTTSLYKAIIGPLEPYLKDAGTIYFAPAGILNSIALENIPCPDGAVLGDTRPIVRLSSTRQLVKPHFAEAQPLRSATLFGGLDYNLGQEEMEYYADASRGAAQASLHDWSYLPGSLGEVNEIGGMLSGMSPILVTGGEGVEERFKALSNQASSIIHVATHGYYYKKPSDGSTPKEDEIMESSGLVFSGANNKRSANSAIGDGLLSAKEIARLNLTGCELLVLSACGSGREYSNGLNEAYGLVRAFKKAGCQSIVMSLWDIDDTVTQVFMRTFYAALLDGHSMMESMKEARRLVRKNYPDPALWAAFVLVD